MNTITKNFGPFVTFPSLVEGLMTDYNQKNSLSKSLPLVNIHESENEFEIELAIPGLQKENIKITIEDKTLKISTEYTKESNSEENKLNIKYIKKEFDYTAFERSFKLPITVDSDKIEAGYDNGVLKLTLPKKEEAKPKEPKAIEVN
jgi:HSP20 family protein